MRERAATGSSLRIARHCKSPNPNIETPSPHLPAWLRTSAERYSFFPDSIQRFLSVPQTRRDSAPTPTRSLPCPPPAPSAASYRPNAPQYQSPRRPAIKTCAARRPLPALLFFPFRSDASIARIPLRRPSKAQTSSSSSRTSSPPASTPANNETPSASRRLPTRNSANPHKYYSSVSQRLQFCAGLIRTTVGGLGLTVPKGK